LASFKLIKESLLLAGNKLPMIKRVFVTALFAAVAISPKAQYYYNDIVNNKAVLAEFAMLKEKKIKGVKVLSIESTGGETEGFTCQKKINRDFTEVEIYTETNESYPNTFISYFDKAGLLQKTIDSSEAGATTIDYRYDGAGRLVSINSSKHFSDDDAGFSNEQHLYQYNNAGILQQMKLVKNNRDSTLYVFEADEAGNIIIEKNAKTGELYYYYYDLKNRLTDVVHSYNFQKNLFSEFTFEYNPEGQVTKMVTSEKEGAYFFTWRYNYEDGLRRNERCYSKEGRLLGTVEYEYK
jgi:YD repeat-containing protein